MAACTNTSAAATEPVEGGKEHLGEDVNEAGSEGARGRRARGLGSRPESPLRPRSCPKVLGGATEPPLPCRLRQPKSTCHLQERISETHLKSERQAGPKGAVSLCPRPWDAEKGEGEEKKEGRQEGQARLAAESN